MSNGNYKNSFFTQQYADSLLAQTIALLSAVLGPQMGPDPWSIESHVRITHNTHRLGSCKCIGGYDFRISISDQAARDPARAQSLMAHEVLHTCPNCFNHGQHFQHCSAIIADQTGIPVTTRFNDASFGDDGHLIKQESKSLDTSSPLVGKHFVMDGIEYRILGTIPRARKWSIAGERADGTDGKKYKFIKQQVMDCIQYSVTLHSVTLHSK